MRNLLLTFAVASLTGVLSAAPTHPLTYRVRKGETAASIARAHGLSLGQLSALNPKLHLSKLRVGMSLHLGRAHVPQFLHTDARQSEAHAPALPATPVLRDAALIHLERILPIPLAPEASRNGAFESPADSPESLSTQLLPLLALPADSAVSSLKAPEFNPADRDHLDLIWPVETRSISSAWGPRMRSRVVRVKNHRKKRVRYRGRHKGVDLNAPMGTSVFAALDGQVVAVGRHRQYGKFVTIDHGNGIVTHYGHHRLNLVEVGDVVRRGQKIAEVGRTGNATGPHLHFELRVDGSQCNPLPFLDDEEEISAEVMAMNAHIGDSHR